MRSPLVQIVVLNWNGLQDTLECLASIAGLTYPSVKVIVVDNDSRNCEAEAIERQFPNTTVLRQSENLGFCGGCNVGITHAIDHGADYVLLLNNDTLVPSDLLEKLLAGIDGLNNSGAVSPVILEYPDSERVWFSNARWVTSDAQFRLSSMNERYEDLADEAPYPSEFACGCCMLVPAEAFRTVGLLDERYFAFYDEADWCSRAKRIGLASYVVPSAVMYHKVSRSTPGLVSIYLLTRNRLLWMKENLGFAERTRSIRYLLREFLWHSSNLVGVTKPLYSKQHSRAVLVGYRDYFLGRFGKWDEAVGNIILSEQ